MVPGGCLVPGGGGSAPGQEGGLVSQHALRQTAHPPTPGETATAADGTHPTGMHSCTKKFRKLHFILEKKVQYINL